MKIRWWIAASLLVAFGLLVQAGCGGGESAALPTKAVEPTEDPADGMEIPPA